MLKNPLILAFIASIFFGIWPAFLKIALSLGASSDVLVWVGTAITLTGCAWKLFEGGTFSWEPALINYSLIGGSIFALGMICTLIALNSKEGYLSLVAPIYNINSMWAMLVGLIFFQEHRAISVPLAVIGAFFITVGGGVIGIAKK